MPFSTLPLTPFAAPEFARALDTWFHASQREMPWRRAENYRSPYRILVSEIMLQQTTVAAVTPFFERFVARFPTLQSLAEAPESEVLAQWAGLGYYSRARNLQRAAQQVVSAHGGEFPTDFADILALPGVGRYTAGAVASIALGQRQPIVDANVARVLSRVLLVEGDLKTASNQAKLWDGAARIVEVEDVAPRAINPALMELGALVCTPKNPRCEVCPVAQWCAARAEHKQNEVPFRAPKAAATALFDVCAWVLNGDGEVLLRQRPENARWWPLMWELPRTTRGEGESEVAALERLGAELGLKWKIGDEVARLKHGVTRYAITLTCLQADLIGDLANDATQTEGANVQWFSFARSQELALPSSMKTLLARLEKRPARQLTLL